MIVRFCQSLNHLVTHASTAISFLPFHFLSEIVRPYLKAEKMHAQDEHKSLLLLDTPEKMASTVEQALREKRKFESKGKEKGKALVKKKVLQEKNKENRNENVEDCFVLFAVILFQNKSGE